MNIRALLALTLLAMPCTSPAVRLGDTRDDVLAELGPPQGQATLKGRLQMFYPGGVIEVQSGRVSHVDGGFDQRGEDRRHQADFDAAQRAKGLVSYDGTWMTPTEAAALEQQKAAHARAEAARARPPDAAQGDLSDARAERIREIREQGARLELSTVLVPGKVTVIDFFADWCGPCRAMAPHLEALVLHDPDLRLCKVDVARWESDVVKQYQILSIPHVRIYNGAGEQVGQPGSSLRQITENIQRAKAAR